MSREIKFRAWDDRDKRYRYAFNMNDFGKVIEYVDGEKVYMPYTVEQYTGLKDKNGKEIYEGDIVKILGYGIYTVFWRTWDTSLSLKAIDTNIEEHKVLMLCEDWESDYDVIGNIHENPELFS